MSAKPKIKYEIGMLMGLSNEEYHRQLHPDYHYYSSSQIKDALEDVAIFKAKYITGELEKKSSPAFDVGNYYHTAILEPALLESEYAVWPGVARKGKEYDLFKDQHKGKTILGRSDIVFAQNCIQATLNSDLCMAYIDDPLTTVEVSFFTEIMGVRVKARTDVLRLGRDRSYVIDLKSTTGNVRSETNIRKKIHVMDYEMSAAFYMDIINDVIKRMGWDYAPVKEWYWVFASKDLAQAQLWKATNDMISVGRSKYRKGLELVSANQKTNWELPERLMVVDAYATEKTEWMPPKENPKRPVFPTMDKLKIGNSAK